MKKQRFPLLNVLFVLTFLSSFWAFSQTKLTGKVIDATDLQPLIGAQIIIQEGRLGTVTDDFGYFEITAPSQTGTIAVKYLGYEEQAIGYTPTTSNMGIIKLVRANTTLDEVIVSASPNNYKTEFKGSNFRINLVGASSPVTWYRSGRMANYQRW